MKAEDMLGQKFGRWTVVSLDGMGPNSKVRVYCKCDCGTEKTLDAYSVKSGHSTSCGCYSAESKAERKTTHGLNRTREHRIWNLMKQRCTNPNNRDYRNYGGRGIRVCDAWAGPNGFTLFVEHMGLSPTADHQIDRIDNDGNYEPGNCRWATRSEQSRNRSNNRLLTWNSETRCVAEWAEIVGLTRSAILCRIDRLGWSIEKALSAPPMRPSRLR